MKKALLFTILVPALLLAAICTYVLLQYERFLTQPIGSDAPFTYTVEPGSNLRAISEDLKQQGLSDFPPVYLQVYGRLTQQAHKIKAGEYQIEPGTSLPQFLDILVSGKVMMNAFTIVEGMTTQELLKALHQHPKVLNTLESVSSDDVMSALGEEKKQAEGWFLPETYHFPSGTKDIDFLKRAYDQMQIALDEAWKDRDEGLPYKSPYEALIMASIIEKETGIAEERPEIAGVFVRRLKKGMRLQTDPTVIYGMGDKFDGNLRRTDLRTDTPYNTYTRFGLPPTPICLPSIESIHAALHPADGNSLYFVATGEEGRHVFSATLQQHNKAVRRYQLKQ
jgi:UPF0755 protein